MTVYDIFVLCVFAAPSAVYVQRCFKGNQGRPKPLALAGIVVAAVGSLLYIGVLMHTSNFY